MELSIEVYFAVNALMAAAVFTLSARRTGRVRAGAILAAALLSGAGAAAVQAGLMPPRFAPAAALLCALLALGKRPFGLWLRGMGACLLWTCAFAGGTLLLQSRLPVRSMWRGALCALPLFAAGLLYARGGRDEGGAHVRLRIATPMGAAEVTALIDTGNRLCEPFSGLPVVIVSGDCLGGILDPVCLDEEAALPPGFRLVRYQALGGGGRMRCFRPESLCWLKRNRWVEAPDMWVAVYSGKIPGAPDALAPPAVQGNP